MNVHKNARLTAHSRAELIRRVNAGQRVGVVAAVLGVSIRTVTSGWLGSEPRARLGPVDRSSRPRPAASTDAGRQLDQIVALRRQSSTGKHILLQFGVSPATVTRCLSGLGFPGCATKKGPVP